MQIIYTPKAKKDLDYWTKKYNKTILSKILQITLAIIENPYIGIAKPEALKHELSGFWSRRITEEHRYIYKIVEDILYIYSLKGHYL